VTSQNMESEPGGCLLSNAWKFAEDFDQMVNGLGMSRHIVQNSFWNIGMMEKHSKSSNPMFQHSTIRIMYSYHVYRIPGILRPPVIFFISSAIICCDFRMASLMAAT